ncbi:hypothetical protein Taro_038033, partial [Colocasia esculenta]|nr:hypothetical protein [Colocasia esculenta]
MRSGNEGGGGLPSTFLLGAPKTVTFFPWLVGEACTGLSAKNISISATTELSWSNPLILVPKCFSLISAARPRRQIVIASSCVGGLSHLMLKSRHHLMKSIAISPLLYLREH